MPNELTYEEFLAELLTFVGRPVAIVVQLPLAGCIRPLAMLEGILRNAQADEIGPAVRDAMNAAGGEWTFVYVGENDAFIVRRDDFSLGKRDPEDDSLAWCTGPVRFFLRPPMTHAEYDELAREFGTH